MPLKKKRTARLQAPRRPRAAGRRTSPRRAAAGGRRRGSGLTAGDMMIRDVITLRPETTVGEASDLFQAHNIGGAPVVDGSGALVGIVTEDDLIFGQMGRTDSEMAAGELAEGRSGGSLPSDRRVAEIMTPNPIVGTEEMPLEQICGLMWRLKIHHIPIVRDGAVTGIVTTIDVCRIVAEGKARILPPRG